MQIESVTETWTVSSFTPLSLGRNSGVKADYYKKPKTSDRSGGLKSGKTLLIATFCSCCLFLHAIRILLGPVFSPLIVNARHVCRLTAITHANSTFKRQLLGRVALGAQRPIVIKLSRGRSVGRSVQCIVEKRRIGSDPDAVWHHRSDGFRDEAGSGVWGSVYGKGFFWVSNLGRAIVSNEDFTAYMSDSAARRPCSQITLGRLVIVDTQLLRSCICTVTVNKSHYDR